MMIKSPTRNNYIKSSDPTLLQSSLIVIGPLILVAQLWSVLTGGRWRVLWSCRRVPSTWTEHGNSHIVSFFFEEGVVI